MSSTANKGNLPKDYVPLAKDGEEPRKLTNNDRKAEALMRKIDHKYRYGVGVFAQQLLKVQELQEELKKTGYPPVDLFKPDWEDASLLPEYAKVGNYRG